MSKFPGSLQIIIISRFLLNLRRSERKNQAVSINLSQVPTLYVGSLVNDMGNPLDHGFNEPEEPRNAEVGPSGTRWHEDGPDAPLNFDAMQLATVYEDEGMVRATSHILYKGTTRSMILRLSAR